MYNLIKPILFNKEAEEAHDFVFEKAEKYQNWQFALTLTRLLFGSRHDSLSVTTSGITFPGPVGLAAGFDKNARLMPILQETGFGFLEIGSITGRSATGNPKPRMFRLKNDLALINRMGLNNEGAKAVIKRFELFKPSMSIPIGINIAKTHDNSLQGDDAINDYRISLLEAAGKADYITVNISCPNTGDGKSFEDPDSFKKLLEVLRNEKASYLQPLFVKLSSDISEKNLQKLVGIAESFEIDGYVAVNTSNSRKGLSVSQDELTRIGNGGLSGKPISGKAVNVLKQLRAEIKNGKTLISVGGISTPGDAHERLMLGADLVQVYTGLIYNGPGFPKMINQYLLDKNWKQSLD